MGAHPPNFPQGMRYTHVRANGNKTVLHTYIHTMRRRPRDARIERDVLNTQQKEAAAFIASLYTNHPKREDVLPSLVCPAYPRGMLGKRWPPPP